MEVFCSTDLKSLDVLFPFGMKFENTEVTRVFCFMSRGKTDVFQDTNIIQCSS